MSLFKHSTCISTQSIVKCTSKNGGGNLRYLAHPSFSNVPVIPWSSRMHHVLASRDEKNDRRDQVPIFINTNRSKSGSRLHSALAYQIQSRKIISNSNLIAAILQNKKYNSTLSNQGNNAKTHITSNDGGDHISKKDTASTDDNEKDQSAARKESKVVKKSANSM